MTRHTAYERFSNAAKGLIGTRSVLRDRLISAAVTLAPLHGERPDVFARQPQLRAQFDDIWRRLTSAQAVGNEGSIAASVRAMTDDEARAVASDLRTLFRSVAGLKTE